MTDAEQLIDQYLSDANDDLVTVGTKLGGPVAWFKTRQGADGFARSINRKYDAGYCWSGQGKSDDWYASFEGPKKYYAEVKKLMTKNRKVLRVTSSKE